MLRSGPYALIALALSVAALVSAEETTVLKPLPSKRAVGKLPQIVPVVRGKELYIAWQGWAQNKPGDKIFVYKISLDALEKGQLTRVREVASLGTFVGFAVDGTGVDHVLTAKAESFANKPAGKFVDEVHKPYRKDVLAVTAKGTALDLNAAKYTDLPFYGITNSGTGRLAATQNHIAAVFARRRYTPRDNLVHQEASTLLVSRDWAGVGIKAGNSVSHSFDQRLIADGNDFLALHQADTYPFAGLIAERISPLPRARSVRVNVFACPTFGNAVYFELGGVAAEKDGYPVLFTATRNTKPVNQENQAKMHAQAWDLALVYVLRGFESKGNGKNPYDTVTSGMLATGYAKDEAFTVDNFTWNPATSKYDKKEPRAIKRRVHWLTEHDEKTRASNAKLVRLQDGQYIALWEERGTRNGARAMLLTLDGKAPAKTVKAGEPIELKDLKLPQGDDALAITIGNKPHAAWVTGGDSDDQLLLLHTLDAELTYKAYPLSLP
ncbi:MAG: hypothetical protein JNM56_33720 [Planctomycetia bacterium]|nr:hypothetical protein [Planctomycetia bacterium]